MPTKTNDVLLDNFQDRIDNPEKYDAIAIKNSDGSKSTIKMASGEGDGKFFAFPTIFLENGRLVEKKGKEAFDLAKKTGQIKVFNTDEEAKSYANNGYKKGTKLENYQSIKQSEMPTKTKPDELTLSFQKWLKAKYPNTDLGKYGVNKDGIDGIMGAKTKALFDKYKGEFKKDISQEISPLTQIGTQKMAVLPTVVDNLLKKDGKQLKRSITDELLAEKSAENTANKMGKDFADAEMLKNRGITDLIAPAVGGIYGLSQLIKGNKRSKNLKAPKRVEPMLPNQQLSSLLAQVGVNANQADPKIRENALRDITTNREMANEVARVASSGDVNAFAQNAQNNYIRSNDAIRKLASDETNDIMKNRALFQSLLGTKMGEDRANHNELVRNFENIDYPEFKAQRENNANLSNQGMNNMFGALNNAVSNSAPLLGGYNNIMSGYKARYNSMTPEEKKAFALKYPKLASKYETEGVINPQTAQSVITPDVAKILNTQPQELPRMPLSYNWQF